MGGYHEAYAITQKNEEAVVTLPDGQFKIYDSMQSAATDLAALARENPGMEFTIRPFKMRLPWTKQGL